MRPKTESREREGRSPTYENFWSLETIGITDFLDVTDDDKTLEQWAISITRISVTFLRYLRVR